MGKQVKVIKRVERHAVPATGSDTRRPGARNSGETVKRDAVTVVTGWVRELRQKKVAEATGGFESLFRKASVNSL